LDKLELDKTTRQKGTRFMHERPKRTSFQPPLPRLSRSEEFENQHDTPPAQDHYMLACTKTKTINPISKVLTLVVDKPSVARGVDVIARVDIWNKGAFPRIKPNPWNMCKNGTNRSS